MIRNCSNSGFQRYSARLADYQVKPWLKMKEMYHLLIMIAVNRILRWYIKCKHLYASNIMGAIYPMYVRYAQGNIMVDNRGFLRYD